MLDKLAAYGTGHALVQGDLTIAEERKRIMPQACKAAGGHLDVLVNNASAYQRAWLCDVTEEQMRRDFEINFFAPFLLMQDFAHHCNSGNIVNLLDQRVNTVDPAAGTYALAKKALRDATETAAVEWAPDVRVNAVAPGIVLPPPGVAREKMLPLLENVPMQTNSSSEEIANACLFLAASETITGQTIYVDGGLHLVQPPAQEKKPKQNKESVL